MVPQLWCYCIPLNWWAMIYWLISQFVEHIIQSFVFINGGIINVFEKVFHLKVIFNGCGGEDLFPKVASRIIGFGATTSVFSRKTSFRCHQNHNRNGACGSQQRLVVMRPLSVWSAHLPRVPSLLGTSWDTSAFMENVHIHTCLRDRALQHVHGQVDVVTPGWL